MTNQEAIEILRELNSNYFSEDFDDVNEAIEIAIHVLEN